MATSVRQEKKKKQGIKIKDNLCFANDVNMSGKLKRIHLKQLHKHYGFW